jgi:AcrR family transcriptional regulator
MAQLLDAAAEVFAESGYEAATTNAIAARAGASPGTLYQFFPNKDAIAEALAERYLGRLGEIFTADIGRLPVPAMIDAIIDPLMAFGRANPGFMALFAGSLGPDKLAPSAQQVYKAILMQFDELLESAVPGVPAERRMRCAQVSVQVIKAVLALVLAASGAERAALVGELKQVLTGYLGPLRPNSANAVSANAVPAHAYPPASANGAEFNEGTAFEKGTGPDDGGGDG